MKLHKETEAKFGASWYLRDAEKREVAVVHFEDACEKQLKEQDLFSLIKWRLRNDL